MIPHNTSSSLDLMLALPDISLQCIVIRTLRRLVYFEHKAVLLAYTWPGISTANIKLPDHSRLHINGVSGHGGVLPAYKWYSVLSIFWTDLDGSGHAGVLPDHA